MNLLIKNLLVFSFYSVLKFYKSFYFDLAVKFMAGNLHILPHIGKIVFTVSIVKGLRSETDVKIINALAVLDILLNKKSSIFYLEQKYLRKAKNLIFVCQTSISHFLDFYLFLILITKVIKPALLKRYIYLKYKLLKDGFVFYIPDVSIIPGLPEDLKKEKVNIKVSVFFKKALSISFFNFFIKYFRL
jgi:hypothetical protein